MLASRSVTTTGHGSVLVPREAAVVAVSAVHHGASLSEALSGAESARAAVVALAQRHVDLAAVSTAGLAAWPHRDDQSRPAGFEARHSLEIRCASLDLAATVLQALADEVGDRLSVDGVSLASTPTPDHLAAAREAAYADARTRAEHLARIAGSHLGAVVAVAEGAPGAGGPGPVARFASSAKAEVGLEGGAEAVATSVTVTWELG